MPSPRCDLCILGGRVHCSVSGSGIGQIDDLEEDWIRRTREQSAPPHARGQVFVYRAFDLLSQTGPFYRATVATHQMMIPDELLWRIALHWHDLGNDWNQVGWRLVPVDDSRSTSCLSDLIHPTYVLIMPGLLAEMSHRPHGLLEVMHGDTCHVRATVLPPRINLPILQELLHAFCRRGWPMVRCSGTHNRATLTDVLQDCSHGFFVQITIAGVVPAHALDISRWCQHAGRLLHIGFQSYTGDFHLFEVGVANGLTLLASSVAQCWGDLGTWHDWLLPEMRTRYLSQCGMEVQLVEVHASIYEMDACFDSGRTYMVAVPMVPPPVTADAKKVLQVRVRVDGFYDDGAVGCPAMISCPGIVEQLGLLVICSHQGDCKCYLNGLPLSDVPTGVSYGDFVAIYKSDGRRAEPMGLVTHAVASSHSAVLHSSASSICASEQDAVPEGASPVSAALPE